MAVNENDRQMIRGLAQRVAEIAADPRQEERRQLWYRHTRLDESRPIVLAFPEGSWRELLPEGSCVTSDPALHGFEWNFRSLIYQWEHFQHDYVIEPVFYVGQARQSTGWGLDVGRVHSSEKYGADRFDSPIKEEADLEKLHEPVITVDDAKTRQNYEFAAELFGDILDVQVKKYLPANCSLIGHLALLRGLEQIMVDMIDRPQWVHKAMKFLADASEKLLLQFEREGNLGLNNRGDYTGSGGQGFTDELPAPGFNGTPRLKDLWGFADAQEIAEVSPAMHEEFVLQYQRRLLEHFGLSSYGCCEALHHKLGYLKKLGNLRRISISPWADVQKSAEGLGGNYIFSWKPNPAELAAVTFNPARIRKQMRETLQISRANGCVVEIIMKDTHTCNNDPSRFDQWTQLASECAMDW